MVSSTVKNSWNWNFADFRDLRLILPEAATGGVLWKKVFLKIVQYSRENTCARVSFLLKLRISDFCNLIKKETLTHGFSCEFFKMFKNIYFPDHLLMTASILNQLLALYFPIIYSWQLSSSEKSLVGKNVHPYISKVLQISFTQILKQKQNSLKNKTAEDNSATIYFL